MANRLICYLNQATTSIRWTIKDILRSLKDGPNFPPLAPVGALGVEANSHLLRLQELNESSKDGRSILEKIMGDGFLWGVPKKGRTYEVMMSRRFETRYWNPAINNKILRPQRNLTVCDNCGHHKKAHTLCRYCYDKVIEETKAIKEKVQQAFGLSPIEKEAKIVYEEDKPTDIDESKVLVEMGKKRPEWFSKSLLQKSSPESQESLSEGSVSFPRPQATIK